jgi:disulfide bond formation protein DsbB
MRWIYLLLFLTALSGMAFALYLQYVEFLEPCNLCILQRVALIYIGLISLVAWLHSPGRTGNKIYALLTLIGAGVGVGLAGRHVWLQNLPESEIPECGPGLEFLIEALPLKDVLIAVFQGSGSCAKISMEFFNYTIPQLTLAMFAVIGILLIVVLLWPAPKLRKINHSDDRAPE